MVERGFAAELESRIFESIFLFLFVVKSKSNQSFQITKRCLCRRRRRLSSFREGGKKREKAERGSDARARSRSNVLSLSLFRSYHFSPFSAFLFPLLLKGNSPLLLEPLVPLSLSRVRSTESASKLEPAEGKKARAHQRASFVVRRRRPFVEERTSLSL